MTMSMGSARSLNMGMLLFLGVMLALFSVASFAGTTGTEFQSLYNTLNGWATGFLGKTIAIAAFILGAGMSLARGSAIPALVGVVIAVFMFYIPPVIASIVSATI